MKSFLTFALLAFVLWKQLPLLIKSFEAEGVKLPQKSYALISRNEIPKNIQYPPLDSRVLTIFWATWCGPCKIEMERLQTSVVAGRVKGSQIVAINPFEGEDVIKKFLSGNKFDFFFINAPEIAQTLKVQVTPTTIFLDKGSVSSMSTGMSLVGIWRAERFLNN